MAVTIEQQNDDGTYLLAIDGVRDRRDYVHATVTASGAVAGEWLDSIQCIHHRRLHRLVVGIDVEWRPNFGRTRNNAVAVLQLCVGRRCLVFQTLHADYIPNQLAEFLEDGRFSFAGVGIGEDVSKLEQDYELTVENAFDLREVAANALGQSEMKQRGLLGLAEEVLGMQGLQKPRAVTLSRWDNQRLSCEQIKYAVADAFLSFEIGRRFLA